MKKEWLPRRDPLRNYRTHDAARQAFRGRLTPRVRDFSVTVENDVAKTFESDIRQILDDLGLAGKVRLE